MHDFTNEQWTMLANIVADDAERDIAVIKVEKITPPLGPILDVIDDMALWVWANGSRERSNDAARVRAWVAERRAEEEKEKKRHGFR